MKKTGYLIALVAICVLTLGALAYIYFSNNKASASIYSQPTTSDIVIYQGSTYFEAKYVKNLLKPAKASAHVFVISNGLAYPTDGIKRDKTDTTTPASDQIKVELARGYFYLAYKNFPNSLAEIPEAKRADAYAFDGKLYYNTDKAVSNNMSICTKGGKTYLVPTFQNSYGACTMLSYGYGMLVDLQGTAKKIVSERVQAQADEE